MSYDFPFSVPSSWLCLCLMSNTTTECGIGVMARSLPLDPGTINNVYRYCQPEVRCSFQPSAPRSPRDVT